MAPHHIASSALELHYVNSNVLKLTQYKYMALHHFDSSALELTVTLPYWIFHDFIALKITEFYPTKYYRVLLPNQKESLKISFKSVNY